MNLNAQQERIATFLSQGLKASQVASIVGCTSAYLSQLLGKDGELTEEQTAFRAHIKAKQEQSYGAGGTTEDEIVTAKYLGLEHKLIQQVEQTMQYAEFPQLVAALRVVGERQEKRAARQNMKMLAEQGAFKPQQIVNISLPSHALPEYQVSGQNEIVSVGGRAMAPLSSSAVKNLFSAKRDGQKMVTQGEVVGAEVLPSEAGNGLEQVLVKVVEDF